MSDLHERPDPCLAITRRRPGESDEQFAARLRAIAAELFVKYGRPTRVDVEPDPVRVDPERHRLALHVAAWAAQRLGIPTPEVKWFSRALPLGDMCHAFFRWSWDVTGTVRRAPSIWLNDDLEGWMLVQAVLHESVHADSDARGLPPLEDEHTAESRTERLLARYTNELRAALPAGGDGQRVTAWMKTAGILGGSGLGAGLQIVGLSSCTFAVLDIQGAGYSSPAAGPGSVTAAVAGIPPAGNTNWVPVGMTIRILVGGTLRVRCLVGSTGAGNMGTVYWDDIRMKKQAASIQIGAWRGYNGISDTGGVYVPDTETVSVGTQTTPSTKPRTIRIAPQHFVPQQTASKWSFSIANVACGITASLQEFIAPVYLPQGVTITLLRARVLRATSGDSNVLVLYKGNDAGSNTALATITTGVSASIQTLTASLSEVVSTTNYYVLDLQMNAAASTANALLLWVELEYSVPDYGKAI